MEAQLCPGSMIRMGRNVLGILGGYVIVVEVGTKLGILWSSTNELAVAEQPCLDAAVGDDHRVGYRAACFEDDFLELCVAFVVRQRLGVGADQEMSERIARQP